MLCYINTINTTYITHFNFVYWKKYVIYFKNFNFWQEDDEKQATIQFTSESGQSMFQPFEVKTEHLLNKLLEKFGT